MYQENRSLQKQSKIWMIKWDQEWNENRTWLNLWRVIESSNNHVWIRSTSSIHIYPWSTSDCQHQNVWVIWSHHKRSTPNKTYNYRNCILAIGLFCQLPTLSPTTKCTLYHYWHVLLKCFLFLFLQYCLIYFILFTKYSEIESKMILSPAGLKIWKN
jgi:hypothetical protein